MIGADKKTGLRQRIWNRLYPRTAWLVLLISGGALSGQDVKEFQKKVTEFTLPNGVQFVLFERHDAPVVSFHTYVRAGTVSDPTGLTGLANLFERISFTGTEVLGSKNWPEERKALDAMEEAYDRLEAERGVSKKISQDRVGALETQVRLATDAANRYGQPEAYLAALEAQGGTRPAVNVTSDGSECTYTMPSNRVELWFLMESQRLMHPVFRDFYGARAAAIDQERQLLQINPQRGLLTAFTATAFEAHPYRVPQSGWPGDYASLRLKDAKAFFEKYYVPGNAAIAIVGDVNPAEIKTLAQRYFGPWAAKAVPPPVTTQEPPQGGPRTVVLESGARQPLLAIGYKRPSMFDRDDAVFDILQFALAAQRTGMLYKELVTDKHLAVEVQAQSTWPGGRYPNLFVFLLAAAQGHTVEENQKAVEEFLNRLKVQRLDADSLSRAKAQTRAILVNRMAGNAGLAGLMASYQAINGDWRQLFAAMDDLSRVTSEDVQRILIKYFNPIARTVAYTVPPGQSAGPLAPRAQPGGGDKQ